MKDLGVEGEEVNVETMFSLRVFAERLKVLSNPAPLTPKEGMGVIGLRGLRA